LSVDIGDDDTASVATSSLVDIRNLKRKRSLGAHTPSRLKDAAVSTDDENETAGKSSDKAVDGQMEIDGHTVQLIEESFVADEDEDEEVGRRKKSKTSTAKDARADVEVSKPAEDETVDVMGLDDAMEPMSVEDKTDAAIDLYLDEIEAEKDGPAPVVDMSWTISSTDYPRVTVPHDRDMILDLDGLQAVIMDDEDLMFLKEALKGETPANVGNVYAYACKLKEKKAANRDGKRGMWLNRM
jgi:histone-lysine N-methyltransferase SETD1